METEYGNGQELISEEWSWMDEWLMIWLNDWEMIWLNEWEMS